MSENITLPIAVIVAGIAGTITNSFGITAWFGADVMPLILSPGRIAIAIIVAGLLPIIFKSLQGAMGNVVAIVALTLIPSTLAKLVFGAPVPWTTAFTLNFIYAITAFVVYLAMRRLLTPASTLDPQST